MEPAKVMESMQLSMLNQAPFGCVHLSGEGRIDYVNQTLLDLLDSHSDGGWANSRFDDFLPGDQRPAYAAFINALQRQADTPIWQSFDLLKSTGERIPILVTGRRDPGSETGLCPITLYFSNTGLPGKPEKSATESRQRSSGDNKYRVIFESATIGIAVFEEDGVIDEVNHTFEEYFNVTREEVIGRPCCEVFRSSDWDKIQTVMDSICAGDQTYERNVVTVDHPSDGQRILEFSLAKIFNDTLDLNLVMMIVEDITNQQTTQKALIQSEKLALTGRLAASLAHEINNPLQTSIGCLGLAEEMLLEDDRDLGVYIKMAIDELRRSARIVKKLRDLNRTTDDTEKSLVDLEEMLNGVLVLTRNRLYDHNIVPVFPFQGKKPLVMASNDQLQQVFLNLIMNAIDALPKGGNIYLDILFTKNPAGVMVKIRDTGVGIQPENLERLFDPFFTTKEDGLGLGLFTSKRIIENHQGWLEVESELGVGTEFSIWLPGELSASEEE